MLAYTVWWHFGAGDLGGLEEGPLKWLVLSDCVTLIALETRLQQPVLKSWERTGLEKDTRTAFKDLNLKTFAQ